MYKKQQNYFFDFFGPNEDWSSLLRICMWMENQGYVVLFEKLFGKLYEKWFNSFYNFEKLLFKF